MRWGQRRGRVLQGEHPEKTRLRCLSLPDGVDQHAIHRLRSSESLREPGRSSRGKPPSSGRWRDRYKSLRHGPGGRGDAGNLERAASGADPQAASGFRRCRIRHHPDQLVRRQRATLDAAQAGRPRAGTQRDSGTDRARRRRPCGPPGDRGRLDRADRRPVRTAWADHGGRGRRCVRRTDAGTRRRRRGRDVDRNHVGARGNAGRGTGRPANRRSLYPDGQLRHGRQDHDGPGPGGVPGLCGRAARRTRSRSAPIAGSGPPTWWPPSWP